MKPSDRTPKQPTKFSCQFPRIFHPVHRNIVLVAIAVFLGISSGCHSGNPQQTSKNNDAATFQDNELETEQGGMVAGRGFGGNSDTDPQTQQTKTPNIFKILSRGPVTINSQTKGFGFSKIELKADGEEKCQVIFWGEPENKNQPDKEVLNLCWKNGSIIAFNEFSDKKVLSIEPKAGKVVLTDGKNDDGTLVFTTSKSVNVYLKKSGRKTLVSKMESFPAYWQLHNGKGEPIGKVDVESQIGKHKNQSGQVTFQVSPVSQSLGVAFLSLKPLPIQSRIALCVYFHQDDF